MTAPQKFAASADMLSGARRADGGAGLPTDLLVNAFSTGISNACVIPTMKLTDAAVGLYLTDPRFKP